MLCHTGEQSVCQADAYGYGQGPYSSVSQQLGPVVIDHATCSGGQGVANAVLTHGNLSAGSPLMAVTTGMSLSPLYMSTGLTVLRGLTQPQCKDKHVRPCGRKP